MENRSPNSLKKITKYGVLTLVVIGAIYFISHYAVVMISITKPDGVSDATIYASRDLTYEKIGGAGIHIIKRDINKIVVKTERNISTLSRFDAPWYGFAYKKIELKRDKNADKIAFKASLKRACGTYSKKLDRLAHYSCSPSPSALMYYKAPTDSPWTLEEISPLDYPSFTPTNYMGGLIGVSYDNYPDTSMGKHLSIVSEDGKTSTLNWPPETTSSNNTKNLTLDQFNKNEADGSVQAKIFTDISNQENRRFILVLPDGTIYLATPHSGSQVDYKKINPPAWYDTENSQTICSLHDIAVTCFRGLSDTPTGELGSKPTQSNIVEFSFEDTTQHETKLEDNLILQDFGATTDGFIFGRNNGKLFYFKKDRRDNTLHRLELSGRADSLTVSNKAYFIQDRGVFAIDTATLDAQQVFYSTNIVPERLTIAGADVFVIGKSVQRQEGYTYAWHVATQDNTGDKERLIDILPSFIEASTYGTIDLVGNSIYIEVPNDRLSSPEDIKQRQAASIRRLKLSGINTEDLNIITPQH